jgi:hypothetical protein
MAARDATHSDGHGGGTHTAVNHWKRLLTVGLRIPVLRPIDPNSPLHVILSEVDVVDCYAWWLIKHLGVNHETAKGYVSTVNAWHRRTTHVPLAGGFSLRRVMDTCDGMARLKGVPPPRIERVGVRPRFLRAGIDATIDTGAPAGANVAACLESTLAGVKRAGEMAVGSRWKWNARRHPTRADVSFTHGARGELLYATVLAVNSKAKGVEALRKLPVRLPADGSYLSPGRALYNLVKRIDPVSAADEETTPLFRDPRTNAALTVDGVRRAVRRAMGAVGLDPAKYGAHSLRIGGATAMDFEGVGAADIKAAGVWSSDAYLRYVRETQKAIRNVQMLCNSNVDDLVTAEFLGVDAALDDEDFE